MKTVIIGGVAAGMSAASKLKRLLKDDVEIVVYEKGGEVSYGACGIPFYISDHIKQGKDLIARTAEEFAKSGIPKSTISCRSTLDLPAQRRATASVAADDMVPTAVI